VMFSTRLKPSPHHYLGLDICLCQNHTSPFFRSRYNIYRVLAG
jgi:hypothetical protein